MVKTYGLKLGTRSRHIQSQTKTYIVQSNNQFLKPGIQISCIILDVVWRSLLFDLSFWVWCAGVESITETCRSHMPHATNMYIYKHMQPTTTHTYTPTHIYILSHDLPRDLLSDRFLKAFEGCCFDPLVGSIWE